MKRTLGIVLMTGVLSLGGCGTVVPERVLAGCNGRTPESVDEMATDCSQALATENGLDSRNTAGALLNRGAAREAAGDMDAAIADFNAALQINPNLPEAYADRAVAWLAKGNVTAAETDSERALQLRPGNYKSYNLRCWIRAVRNGQLDAALADCTEALRLSPGNPHALDSLGLVLLRQGRFAEAEKAFDSAIAGLPENPAKAGSLYMRGLCRKALRDIAGADADFSVAIKLNPAVETYLRSLKIIS